MPKRPKGPRLGPGCKLTPKELFKLNRGRNKEIARQKGAIIDFPDPDDPEIRFTRVPGDFVHPTARIHTTRRKSRTS